MTFKAWNNEKVTDYDLNGNFNRAFTINGLNHIRSLIDRAGIYSTGLIDGWGEAYVDADGQNDSVDTASTYATFDTDKYTVTDEDVYFIDIYATSVNTGTVTGNGVTCVQIASGQWRAFADAYTNAVNRARVLYQLFHGLANGATQPNGVTGLTKLESNDSGDDNLYVTWIRSRMYTYTTAGGNNFEYERVWTCGSGDLWYDYQTGTSGTGDSSQVSNDLESPSGGTTILNTDKTGGQITGDNWFGTKKNITTSLKHEGIVTSIDNSGTVYMDMILVSSSQAGSVTDTLISGTTPSTLSLNQSTSFQLEAFTGDDSSVISHDIPTGTFSSTASSAIGVPLIEDWETGANIQYKLTNATEDSGWLDAMDTAPEVSSFTAFTSEPTKLIVKLIPKTTSPTAGYPSINGFYVDAQ